MSSDLERNREHFSLDFTRYRLSGTELRLRRFGNTYLPRQSPGAQSALLYPGASKMGRMRGQEQAAMPQLTGYTSKCPQIYFGFADNNEIHVWEKEPAETIRNINVITEVY